MDAQSGSTLMYVALAATGIVALKRMQKQNQHGDPKQRLQKKEIERASKQAQHQVEEHLNPMLTQSQKTKTVETVKEAAQASARKWQKLERPLFAADGVPVQRAATYSKLYNRDSNSFVSAFFGDKWIPIDRSVQQKRVTQMTPDMKRIIDPIGFK